MTRTREQVIHDYIHSPDLHPHEYAYCKDCLQPFERQYTHVKYCSAVCKYTHENKQVAERTRRENAYT